MYNPAVPGSSNNVKEIMEYLKTPPQKPFDLATFSAWWKEISDEEKEQFKTTPLV
jgi:hypothetical protein